MIFPDSTTFFIKFKASFIDFVIKKALHNDFNCANENKPIYLSSVSLFVKIIEICLLFNIDNFND